MNTKDFLRRKFTVEEVKKFKLEGRDLEFMERDLIGEEFQTIQNVFKDYEVVPMVAISYYKDSYSYEYTVFYVKYKGELLRPIKSAWNKKSYMLYLKDNDYYKPYREMNKAPNFIGKASDKKMNDWLEYLIKERETKLSDDNKVNNNKKTAIDEINSKFGDIVVWSYDNTEAIIRKNGIVAKVRISEDGLPYYKFEVDYRVNRDLETFEKLVNNSYN